MRCLYSKFLTSLEQWSRLCHSTRWSITQWHDCMNFEGCVVLEVSRNNYIYEDKVLRGCLQKVTLTYMEKVYLLKVISYWLKSCFEQLPNIFVWCGKTHWEALKRKTIIVENNVCIVITHTINTLGGYIKVKRMIEEKNEDIEYWTNDLYMLRRVHRK